MTTPNPDPLQEKVAETLAQDGASEQEIGSAAEGLATVLDANVLAADAAGFTQSYRPQGSPFSLPMATLPTLPTLPTGYDWVVELREGTGSTNLTDHSHDDYDYDFNGWFWEDGRPMCGHKVAIIFLRQNRVIVKRRTVQVEGLDTERAYVTRIVEEANRIFGGHDFDRLSWSATDFPNPSDVS